MLIVLGLGKRGTLLKSTQHKRRGAAIGSEQRSARHKHCRGERRELPRIHKARTDFSPSPEGYSSDDESYYSE
eukprot:2530164-Amphidinium_carterae.1